MQLSTLNIVWTVIGLIGLLASGRTFRESIIDYRKLRGVTHERRKTAVALMAVMSEMLTFAVLSFFVLLGVIAITAPQRFLTVEQTKLLNYVIIGLFIFLEISLTAQSLARNYLRKIALERDK